ncbi:hypothetical protein N1851_023110 [Merluccius polli]|uniref:Reverse transcriptase n=1 Tax=Merluccius polli TaxID=89951 RepID=A0AA47MGQ6_MERPO|nr:hypothetical protein N1851_023110 [Merluccius polli]
MDDDIVYRHNPKKDVVLHTFILGDFNGCRLDCVLPSLQQYVDIPTRRGNILDLCYGNITDAFRARSYPPLGLADHNVICLLPLYRQELKRHKPQCHSAPQWSEDGIIQLQGSLACTDWDTFGGDLDDRVSVITDYIKFCIHTTIPSKIIRIYPNSKPWITPQIKQSLKEKHKSFRHKDWASLKATNRNIRNEVFKAKLDYKNKLETEFSNMNTKQETFTKELNTFFTRHDNQDFSSECQVLLRALPPPDPEEPAPFTEEEVRRELSRCKPGKAPGPDGISARYDSLVALLCGDPGSSAAALHLSSSAPFVRTLKHSAAHLRRNVRLNLSLKELFRCRAGFLAGVLAD